MGNTNLLFRTDANIAIGTGHVMRCLALAQAWQDEGGRAVFAMAETTPALQERLRSEGIEIVYVGPRAAEDSRRTIEIARELHAEWIVLDGYQFGYDYQQAVKRSSRKLAFFDDNAHCEKYVADLVINQNIHAHESMYARRLQETTLLLGPRYASLRREFWAYRGWKRDASQCRRLLVTFGGSDPLNLTHFVLEILEQINNEDLSVIAVVGGSNPHLRALQKRADCSRFQLQLLKNPANLAEIMASADIAISAAGSTCWEMCFMGLPALIVDVALNQRELARGLAQRGAALHLTPDNLNTRSLLEQLEVLISSPETRRSLSTKAQELVDGNGALRVLAAMSPIRLRPTVPSDCQFLWEWANDPQVRAMSFSTEPIPWERHVAWFTAKLSDHSTLLYMATDAAGRPLGQIRYELGDGRAAVSVSISPQFRGKGYGKRMLLLGSEELFRHLQVHTIDAFVKPCNQRSLRLFKAAGFSHQGMAHVQGQEAVHLTLGRTP